MEMILQIALWVPFALVVSISGAIFMVTGFKRGLWRALIGLGATVVSSLLSLLFARLLSGVVAQGLVPMVLKLVQQLLDVSAIPQQVMPLVQGAVQVVLALAFYVTIFFSLTIILRAIGGSVCGEKLRPKATWQKVLGMFTGAFCALVYTLLLLLPLYGTMGAYVPAAQALVKLAEQEEQSQTQKALQTITDHPVVQMSGSGPAKLLYEQLSQMELTEGSVNVAQMAQAMTDSLDAVQGFMEAESVEDRLEKAEELIDVLRFQVVQQPWFHTMSQEVITQARAALPQQDSPEKQILVELLDIVDCPQEDFAKNCSAILDFMAYVLDQDIMAIAEAEDEQALYDTGIIAKAGALANVTDEAVQVKRVLLRMSVAALLDKDLEKADAFLDRYQVGAITDPQAQEQEAEAILAMMGVAGGDENAMLVMRHPQLGEPAIRELIQMTSFQNVMGVAESPKNDRWSQDPQVQEQLIRLMAMCAKESLFGLQYGEYRDALVDLGEFAETGRLNVRYLSQPEYLCKAAELMGKDRFVSYGRSHADLSYAFLTAWVQVVRQEPECIFYEVEQLGQKAEAYDYAITAMDTVLTAARSGKLPKSLDGAREGEKAIAREMLLISRSQSVLRTMEQLTEEKGKDPLKLAIGKTQRKVLQQLIGELEVTEETSAILYGFFGL